MSSASYYFNSFPEQSCLSQKKKKKSAIVIYPFSGERNFPGLISHSLQLVLPISFGLGMCRTLDGEGGINTFWPRGFGTQTLSKPLWEHGIKQALQPSEGQAAWWRAARSTGLARRPEHARSPSPERPQWGARGWPWIPTPEGLVLDPPPPSSRSPASPTPRLPPSHRLLVAQKSLLAPQPLPQLRRTPLPQVLGSWGLEAAGQREHCARAAAGAAGRVPRRGPRRAQAPRPAATLVRERESPFSRKSAASSSRTEFSGNAGNGQSQEQGAPEEARRGGSYITADWGLAGFRWVCVFCFPGFSTAL